MRATLAEWQGVTTRSPLATLAAGNVASTRAAVSGTFAAKPDPGELPHTVRDASPVPTPRTLWQAATGEAAPVKAPESIQPEPAPEPVHEPIKAAELDKELKAAAKRIMEADGPDGWRLVGVMNRESGRVKVYVRKHGASVRYSTAA